MFVALALEMEGAEEEELTEFLACCCAEGYGCCWVALL